MLRAIYILPMSSGDQNKDDIGLDQMLCFAVYKAEQAFNRVYRTALEPLGLTYPQFLIMRELWRDGSLSVGQITERLGLDTGTVTPILKRLTAMGLVQKTRRVDDERRVDISLSEAGDALRAKSAAVMQCIGEALGMDAAAATEMLATVNRLTANLGKAVDR